MAKVLVTINPKTGEVQYQVEGVVGGTCTDITRLLTQHNEVVEQRLTAEFCEPETLPDYITNPEGE
jgi:hypothetical protein